MSTNHDSTWFSAFFRKGHLLALSLIIILVAGLSALSNLPRLEDPRIDLRNASIFTSYPGASAERVEALVTDVIEDELRQFYELKEITSTSKAGFSSVSISLQDWVDNSSNQQIFSKVRDAIDDAAKSFPAGVNAPILEDKRGATAFTVLLALSPKYAQQSDLALVGRLTRELADRIRNVPGTELVRIYGEPKEEITVTIDPQQLALSGISLEQVSQRIQNADVKLPAGVLYSDLQDMRVQVAEPLASTALLAQVPLQTGDGRYLRLQDIANIEKSQINPEQNIAIIDGEQAVFIAARMQTTVRVDTWTQGIFKELEDFDSEFGNSVKSDVIFEQNKYTDARLGELSGNLLLGSLVVMLVILFFMGAKASWIVGLALPLCASFAVFSLTFFDQQIHQMSIFGIIIAIGLLIDNAIVITDEIRINLLDNSISRLQVLNKSVRHLFSPLLASTLTTILGFMPIFLLAGNIGDFIGPIAISVVMALIGSLAISLTLIAALAARYLPRDAKPEAPWYLRGFQLPSVSSAFRGVIAKAIHKPLLILPLVVVFCLSGFVLSQQLANVFFPSADRDQFEVYLFTPAGSSIKNTRTLTLQADEYIRAKDGVEQVTWLIGASTPSIYYNQIMTRENNPNFANAVITADSVESADSLIFELQLELQDAFPNSKIIVRKFSQGPPIAAPIEVDIFGPDLQILDELGQQVNLAMSKIPGITQSLSSVSTGEPELVVDLSEDQSYLSGLGLSDIAQQLQISLAGKTGGSILEGTEELKIRVRVSNEKRSSLQELDTLPLIGRTANSNVPNVVGLGALGELNIRPSISAITRVDGERVNKIQAYLFPDIPAITVSEQLRLLIEEMVTLPQGYRIKMAGDADEQQQALGQLATYLPVLLVLMITSLILSFSSVRFAVVIASVAMLSVGLGFLSLWLSGLPIGFNPLLGSAGLIGVAINGSIVVIAAIAANKDAMQGDTNAIVSETMSCSRHILSTTFTTVGGLIPLLLFSEGSFWPPLAVVLAGGVGFSVILSLLFTPVLVATLNRIRYRKLCRLAGA
ncbi:efflux RND transporter permease subunit [Glaciecola petra]|uniref:Efflux RND transporter permease subunit n=1 Tax=Glaciecola petra TaxID=3075602 RepID=A0ABU2ZTI8_9ALTE|nr:efflux RND transporter permease subunit [Aestuariibacter sp. P117]MDT0595571.1 efflux RND transporter permease subunit [Aestuariibacter sp. P117]